MIIIIGNQKGGVGKSTLAVLAANYLALEKGVTTTVIDMDYQRSISQKFDKAKILENDEPYDVMPASLEDFPLIIGVLQRNPTDVVLVDLPGKLDDDGLIPVFEAADLVICPFAYEEFTFQSTVLFAIVLKKVNAKVKIVFVPNRIKANVKFEIMSEVNAQLIKIGELLPSIPDRIDFQRITTFATPQSLHDLMRPVLEGIFTENLWKK